MRFAVQSMDFVDSTLSLPDLLKDGTVDRLVLDISAKALLTQLLLPAPADLTLIGMSTTLYKMGLLFPYLNTIIEQVGSNLFGYLIQDCFDIGITVV